MLVLRVDRERRGYLLSRLPEWLAALALFSLGSQYISPGNGFALSRVYSILDAMASECTWAILALSVATARLVALILNVESAYCKITEIVADARKGDVQKSVAVIADFGTIVFATLDTYKIDLPVVTGIFLGKPNLHSAGVDKSA